MITCRIMKALINTDIVRKEEDSHVEQFYILNNVLNISTAAKSWHVLCIRENIKQVGVYIEGLAWNGCN